MSNTPTHAVRVVRYLVGLGCYVHKFKTTSNNNCYIKLNYYGSRFSLRVAPYPASCETDHRFFDFQTDHAIEHQMQMLPRYLDYLSSPHQ